MKYAFEIDAADVLGVTREATLEQIHTAYRARVKKHHPDAGGEAWAFRAVARAYELLSNARIHARIGPDWLAPEAPSGVWTQPAPKAEPRDDDHDHDHFHHVEHPAGPVVDEDSSIVQPGVADRVSDPVRVVGVELFTIRFEITSPFSLLSSPKDRNLSSCLNVTWPAPPLHEGEPETKPDPETLRLVLKAFEKMPKQTKAVASWSRSGDGRFVGWMSYPTAARAYEAFEAFHRSLNDRGLAVRQSTRELFLSREGR